MKKILSALLVGSALFATSANASTVSFDVYANPHVWNNGNGYGSNLGLETDIFFDIGDAFKVTVDDVNDTWNFCTPSNSCTINADGVRPAYNNIYGQYVNSGASFAYGTLVGRVGSGDFFQVGTAGFDGTADATGELVLFHWDHNTNNSGSIAVTVNPVPLPASVAFLLAGLGFLGFAGRRRMSTPA